MLIKKNLNHFGKTQRQRIHRLAYHEGSVESSENHIDSQCRWCRCEEQMNGISQFSNSNEAFQQRLINQPVDPFDEMRLLMFDETR